MREGLDYTKMQDAELADLLRARDTGAVRFVATRYNQRLFRAAWAILKDTSEAEDAVQNGYLKAFAAIDGFEGRSTLSTWLTRIVINEALVIRRTAQRRAPFIGDVDELRAETAPAENVGYPTSQLNPEHHVANMQLQKALDRALERLPEIYRIVFVLREIEGMTVEEAAAALNVLPATVRTRFFRARRMLQSQLASVDRSDINNFMTFAGAACNSLTDRLAKLVSVQMAHVDPSFH